MITINRLVLITLLAFGMSSCSDDASNQQKVSMPLELQVLRISEQQTDLQSEFPTSLKGKEDIEIRSKVDGYIKTVHVDEGEYVKNGQVLFTIENPTYTQTLQNSIAAVEVAKAAVEAAKLKVQKTEALVGKEIVSDYTLETAIIDLKSKEANLSQAKANMANAQANVKYLTIKSPFDGVVGSLPFKLGSYVNSASEPLTVISNISTIYAYFSITESQFINWFHELEGQDINDKVKHLDKVDLILADGSKYAQQGTIETISGLASSTTGSFNVRAAFQNESFLLRSGGSATVVTHDKINNAILIPQSASYEIQGKRFIYIVDNSGVVHQKEVKINEVPGGQLFSVVDGLSVGETIVIEGISKLSDGLKIKPISTQAK